MLHYLDLTFAEEFAGIIKEVSENTEKWKPITKSDVLHVKLPGDW